MTSNGKMIKGLQEYVDYKTLKDNIRNKTGFCILLRKDLIWQKIGSKRYAYIQNYKNNDVRDDESIDCRMVFNNEKLEHYMRGA